MWSSPAGECKVREGSWFFRSPRAGGRVGAGLFARGFFRRDRAAVNQADLALGHDLFARLDAIGDGEIARRDAGMHEADLDGLVGLDHKELVALLAGHD